MTNIYSEEITEKPGAFPGWAVKFEDGSWQCGGHGFHRSNDAGYAERHDTQEIAHFCAQRCQEDYKDKMPYEIIPGWEPLCEELRNEIIMLKKSNTISPNILMDVVFDLQQVIATLKKGQ